MVNAAEMQQVLPSYVHLINVPETKLLLLYFQLSLR